MSKVVKRMTLMDEINGDSVDYIIGKLFKAERKRKADRIELWLTTPGGSVDAGFVLIDVIRQLTIPVDIVASGACMSMGPLILQAADRRYATPNTRFMIHPMTSGFYGHVEEGRLEIKEAESVEYMTTKYLAKRIGMSTRNLKRFQKRLRYMSSDEALKYNFIDDIRRPPKQ